MTLASVQFARVKASALCITLTQKTHMSHLTHLSHSGSLHGQKDSFFTYFWVILSVYGSNESNDSFRFFCACYCCIKDTVSYTVHSFLLTRWGEQEYTTRFNGRYWFSYVVATRIIVRIDYVILVEFAALNFILHVLPFLHLFNHVHISVIVTWRVYNNGCNKSGGAITHPLYITVKMVALSIALQWLKKYIPFPVFIPGSEHYFFVECFLIGWYGLFF